MDKELNTVGLLNSLLKKNCDAKRGYHKAAEEIDQPALKGWLMSLAEQRENFKKSIKAEIRYLGGEPAVFHQVKGKIQEAFAKPELLHLLNSIEQTLEECFQHERKVLAEYENLLSEAGMPPSTQNLIIGQRENIKLALTDLEGKIADSSYSM